MTIRLWLVAGPGVVTDVGLPAAAVIEDHIALPRRRRPQPKAHLARSGELRPERHVVLAPNLRLHGRSISAREGGESAQRHLGPFHPVEQLVTQIGERRVELEQAQQRRHLLERCVQAARARELIVAREKYAARLLLPLLELRLPFAALVRGDQRALL